jgi:hypothetical protein
MLLPVVTPPETPNSYGIFGTHKTRRRTPLRRYCVYSSVASCQGQQTHSTHSRCNRVITGVSPLLPFELHNLSLQHLQQLQHSCRLSSQVSTHAGPKQDKQNDPNRKRVSPCMACSLRPRPNRDQEQKSQTQTGQLAPKWAEHAEQAEHGRERSSPCPVWRQRPPGAGAVQICPTTNNPLELKELTRWRNVPTLKLATPVTRTGLGCDGQRRSNAAPVSHGPFGPVRVHWL